VVDRGNNWHASSSTPVIVAVVDPLVPDCNAGRSCRVVFASSNEQLLTAPALGVFFFLRFFLPFIFPDRTI
jgi:hypothetical protein